MHGEDEEEGFEVEVVESGEPVVSEKELETETCGIVRGRSVEKLAVNAVLCPEAASAMELAEKDSQIVVSVGVEGLEEGNVVSRNSLIYIYLYVHIYTHKARVRFLLPCS